MNPEIPIDRFEVFASGLDHPECCAFDRDGNLWAGGEAGQIYRIDPTGKVETIANLGGFCGGLAFSPDDRELFVCVAGVGVVRVAKNGEHRVFATHAGDHKIVAPNYLAVRPPRAAVCHRQRQVDEAKRLRVAIRSGRTRRSAGRTVRICQRPGA